MPTPDEFHLCVQYYRQPTPPPEEWEEDLKHIKRLGFTAVQLRPQWAWHEPREGEFRWDDLDRLIDLTAKTGLKVLFKFLVESAPLWLFRDYDAARVAPDSRPLLPRAQGAYYLGGWWPCFDRPLVREKAERFFVQGVRRYRDRENILGWHLWNEPRSRPFEDCACRDSNALYRRWLAERYGSVEAFNARFGLAIPSWEDINPPGDLSAYYDSWLWRTWRAYAVADRIAWLADLVRIHDSSRPIFCHVGFNSVLQPTLLDTCHDVLTSRPVDVYGTSLPHWTGDFHTFFKVDRPALFSNPACREEAFLYSLQARWIASVKDYFWINEVYGNNWNYMAEDYSGDDIRFMLLSTISEGARGIVIWQFKPERFSQESITSGLVELDGADTDRSLAAGIICRALSKAPEAFMTYRPEKAQAAIVFDFSADMYSEIEDAEDFARTGTVCYRYKESLKGYYSLLWQLGLAVDLVPVEYLELIENYKLIILPYFHLLEKEQAEIIQRFVISGGVCLSDPGLAFRDGRAWVQKVRPGWGLDKLFGCREVSLKAVGTPCKVRAMGLGLSASRLAGRLIPYEGALDLSDGNGLLVTNCQGSGRTFYFGFYPGLSYRDTGEKNYLRLMEKVLSQAGLKSPNPAGSPLVRVRLGTVGGKGESPAAFVFNYENAEIELPTNRLEKGVYRCLINGRVVDTSKPCKLAARETLFLVPLDY
ncbi:MAG TPA: beta-galactosidase [archaeon]|nr:beta-galactosidase [archaeon]